MGLEREKRSAKVHKIVSTHTRCIRKLGEVVKSKLAIVKTQHGKSLSKPILLVGPQSRALTDQATKVPTFVRADNWHTVIHHKLGDIRAPANVHRDRRFSGASNFLIQSS